MPTTSDLIVERLLEWGVDTYFTLPGDAINAFFEALRSRHDRLNVIHVRNEEVGAMAAVGYAKFTGRPAVVVTTSGPGALHVINGLYDAKIDEAPMLAITGMQYHDVIGTRFMQDIDQDRVFVDACWFNQRVMGPEHAVPCVDLAVRSAVGHRGPSHLAIPIDIQAFELDEDAYSTKNVPGHTSVSPQPAVVVPPSEELQRAAEVLAGCSRIAILAGAGARGAGDELEEVAEILGAPIAKAQLGKDCVPDDSPYTTGAMGLVGTQPTQQAFDTCDGFLIVGSSTPYQEWLPQPGQARGVQIDLNPDRIGLRFPAEVGLVGHAKPTLRALIPLLRRNEDREFLERAQAGMRDWYELMAERGASEETPMKPQVVQWHLPELMDDDAIFCGDSGTVTAWQAHMKLRRGQRFSFSGTMCSMAAALPYAIGAAVAHPGRQVVAFTGDGSLAMHMGDLATAVQHRLPIKLIVMRNNALGLIKWEQMAFLGNPQFSCDLSPIDFTKVAEGCGLRAVRIEEPARCREQLREALAAEGPVLVECVVDPDEPPLSGKILPEHAKNMATALRRGEPSRERVALTMTRDFMAERHHAASPLGVTKRLRDKVADAVGSSGPDGG